MIYFNVLTDIADIGYFKNTREDMIGGYNTLERTREDKRRTDRKFY